MRWSFTIEGQPVSWNAAYRIGSFNRRAYNRAAHEVRTIIKTDEAVAYTTLAMIRAREKKPSGWLPEGFVRVSYRLFLTRDIDCDNIAKCVHDGLAQAIGINDRMFLPCFLSKVYGLRPERARVEVEIEDEPSGISGHVSSVRSRAAAAFGLEHDHRATVGSGSTDESRSPHESRGNSPKARSQTE